MMQIVARMSQSEKASETTGRVEYLFIIRSANLQQMLSKDGGQPVGTYKSHFYPPLLWFLTDPGSSSRQP